MVRVPRMKWTVVTVGGPCLRVDHLLCWTVAAGCHCYVVTEGVVLSAQRTHMVEKTSGTIGAWAPIVLEAHLFAGWAHELLTLPTAASLSPQGCCVNGTIAQDHHWQMLGLVTPHGLVCSLLLPVLGINHQHWLPGVVCSQFADHFDVVDVFVQVKVRPFHVCSHDSGIG